MSSRKVFTVFFLIMLCKFASAQEFISTPSSGCSELAVKFTITGIDTNTFTNVTWDFGNGESSSKKDPDTVYYSNPGVFSVSMQIESNAPIVHNVEVHETASAQFRFDSLSLLEYNCIPIDTIKGNDQFAYGWEYFQGNTSLENITNILNSDNFHLASNIFEFPDTGLYRVNLRVRNLAHDCVDSLSRMLSIMLPPVVNDKARPGNVFVPDSPEAPYYIIDPEDSSIILYFEVFSRSGVSIFKTESPVIYWDGRTNNGQDISAGVYYYVLKATQGDPAGYYSTGGFIHIFHRQ